MQQLETQLTLLVLMRFDGFSELVCVPSAKQVISVSVFLILVSLLCADADEGLLWIQHENGVRGGDLLGSFLHASNYRFDRKCYFGSSSSSLFGLPILLVD